MFKHYLITNDEFGTFEYYVGATSDIKALYGAIRRNKATWLQPAFLNSPVFSEHKHVYALCIDENNYVKVLNSDTMLEILLDRSNSIVEL